MAIKKLLVLVSFLIVSNALVAEKIDFWNAPVSVLASIAKEIHSDPITPLFLIIRDKKTKVIYAYNSNLKFNELLNSELAVFKSYTLENVLKLLNYSSDEIKRLVQKAGKRDTIIAIDYVSNSCADCTIRAENLNEIGDEYFVLSYNIKSDVNILIRNDKL